MITVATNYTEISANVTSNKLVATGGLRAMFPTDVEMVSFLVGTVLAGIALLAVLLALSYLAIRACCRRCRRQAAPAIQPAQGALPLQPLMGAGMLGAAAQAARAGPVFPVVQGAIPNREAGQPYNSPSLDRRSSVKELRERLIPHLPGILAGQADINQ